MAEKEVIVLGAGAAGMVAAISAARNHSRVTIIEHTDRIGRKILSTGNGKCNFTNEAQGIDCYRGLNPAFVLPALNEFGVRETVDFFYGLGIYPKVRNGYYYPNSEQASAICDVLQLELARSRVNILTECNTFQIQKTGSEFCLHTNRGDLLCDSLIIACGLKAFPKSGSDGSAFPLIERLGHRLLPVTPALVQLITSESDMKLISGVRIEMKVSAFSGDRFLSADQGEVQLTDFGISGIPTFQISRFISQELYFGHKTSVILDYLPNLNKEDTELELTRRFYDFSDERTAEESLIGLLNRKVITFLLKKSGIRPTCLARDISLQKFNTLIGLLKGQRLTITGTKDFDQAQVCAGGVDTAELVEQTMESRLVKGLFFAGEVIDIDGICGGYNLQWAWSSGYLAGKYASLQEE